MDEKLEDCVEQQKNCLTFMSNSFKAIKDESSTKDIHKEYRPDADGAKNNRAAKAST